MHTLTLVLSSLALLSPISAVGVGGKIDVGQNTTIGGKIEIGRNNTTIDGKINIGQNSTIDGSIIIRNGTVGGKFNAKLDVNELIDVLRYTLKPDLNEARPWLLNQQPGWARDPNAERVYINCIKSSSAFKGCPAEYPWNKKGCFFWLNSGGITWRECRKAQSGNAYWDAGSPLLLVYESEPINRDSGKYQILMESARKSELIEKLNK